MAQVLQLKGVGTVLGGGGSGTDGADGEREGTGQGRRGREAEREDSGAAVACVRSGTGGRRRLRGWRLPTMGGGWQLVADILNRKPSDFLTVTRTIIGSRTSRWVSL